MVLKTSPLLQPPLFVEGGLQLREIHVPHAARLVLEFSKVGFHGPSHNVEMQVIHRVEWRHVEPKPRHIHERKKQTESHVSKRKYPWGIRFLGFVFMFVFVFLHCNR